MKRTLISSLLISLSLASSFSVQSASLTQDAKAQRTQEASHDRQRESGFKRSEAELRQEKSDLTAEKQQIQKEIDQLSAKFSQNEDSLAKLEEKLRLESGSLGEMFGVVRQNAKELNSNMEDAVSTADHNQYSDVIADIVAAKSLPSLKQLNGLWLALQDQISASGEIKAIDVPFVDQQGEKSTKQVIRLGNLAMIDNSGYLEWDDSKHQATSYSVQPDNAPTLSSVTQLMDGKTQYLPIDPSKGMLIKQLENEPTLSDRIKAGGVIGNIIIGLLVIGLIIAIYRGVVLMVSKQKINAQLKNPSQLGDNPLARVLGVYKKDNSQSVEALELRLLEAVIDEQSHLEKGLSMLKLLAALAPMLGLLGTVTGMIETFQVITLFGNGDPKVMAGGISMALVTTVLGLVAAMPLLLAHNILTSQSEAIRTILEKQGIGLVAEQAEKDGLKNVLGKAA
ncbi:MotA/TolQ/ExbB proton channel family protein [Vibrio viridaestus]|uniref:Flagellar motor protein MotA n=1 Tax=Vibrio viridaestus TaxID=2487322 RepID=A0A3N9TI84_9VIBR|nr:MotA/TolQ/ExbB proton channel family protein [Vibrio viridaestus]RQW63603.1 flagellar motor protein MotA [Vibrio viridaestus]